MPHLPQKCPRCEFGTLEIAPALETEMKTEISGGTEYVTYVTVICSLVVDCDSCDFVEIISHDKRYVTFDQFFPDTNSVETSNEFFREFDERNQLAEEV